MTATPAATPAAGYEYARVGSGRVIHRATGNGTVACGKHRNARTGFSKIRPVRTQDIGGAPLCGSCFPNGSITHARPADATAPAADAAPIDPIPARETVADKLAAARRAADGMLQNVAALEEFLAAGNVPAFMRVASSSIRNDSASGHIADAMRWAMHDES